MQAILVTNIGTVHSRLTESVNAGNPAVWSAMGGPGGGGASPTAMAALNGQVSRQASMVAYVDVFHLMLYTTVLAMPLVFFLRKPSMTTAAAPEPLAAD